MLYEAKISVARVNWRAEPFVTAARKGEVFFGDICVGDFLHTAPSGDAWLHTVEINGQPRDGWLAVRYGGGEFASLVKLASLQATVSIQIGNRSFAGQVQLDGSE